MAYGAGDAKPVDNRTKFHRNYRNDYYLAPILSVCCLTGVVVGAACCYQPKFTTVNLIDVQAGQPINLIQSRSFLLIGSFVIVFGLNQGSKSSKTSPDVLISMDFPCYEDTVLSPIIIIFIRNFPCSRQRNPLPEWNCCRQTVLRIRSVVVVLEQD